MRCPVCQLEITDIAIAGTLAQHTCRRCAVYLVEGLDGSVYNEDLLALLERIVQERKVTRDRAQE